MHIFHGSTTVVHQIVNLGYLGSNPSCGVWFSVERLTEANESLAKPFFVLSVKLESGIMFGSAKNSKKQGDIGLGSAIGWFTENNYTVCIPLTDSQDYDLVVEKDNGLEKVQVKTTGSRRPLKGYYEVCLKTSGGNKSGTGKVKKFDGAAVSLLFILVSDGSKYLIPSEKIKATSAISLGEKWQKYKVIA